MFLKGDGSLFYNFLINPTLKLGFHRVILFNSFKQSMFEC